MWVYTITLGLCRRLLQLGWVSVSTADPIVFGGELQRTVGFILICIIKVGHATLKTLFFIPTHFVAADTNFTLVLTLGNTPLYDMF